MPTYYKSTSPKQHSQQREQQPAAWLGGSTHHRSNSPYGFIPFPVPWYALSGFGYQPHHFSNSPSGGVFIPSDQPSNSMSANCENTRYPSSSEQPQGESIPSQGHNGGTSGADNSDNNNDQQSSHECTTGILIPSPSRASALEPQTDHALRFLARHLQEATTLCEGYLREHETNIEGVKLYLDIASRDRLWAGLLESKFKEDEGNRHMLRSLPFDIDAAVRRALNAAHKEKKLATAAASSAVDQQDKVDWCDKRAHEIEILRMRCVRVAKLAGMALATPSKCKKLVEEMTMIQQTIETMCLAKAEE